MKVHLSSPCATTGVHPRNFKERQRPGNLWQNNGPQVSEAIKAAAAAKPAFQNRCRNRIFEAKNNMKEFTAFLGLLLTLTARAGLTPVDLRCDYASIRSASIRRRRACSGNLPPAPGQKQTAYQILVASSSDSLKHDSGDVWDSGRVDSTRTSKSLLRRPVKILGTGLLEGAGVGCARRRFLLEQARHVDMGVLSDADWMPNGLGRGYQYCLPAVAR